MFFTKKSTVPCRLLFEMFILNLKLPSMLQLLHISQEEV